MSFLDRILGRSAPDELQQGGDAPRGGRQLSDDELALERYRYMLRTAPPEDIERAHEEAFTALTPEQRRMVLQELSAEVPEGERAGSDDPRNLARMATRAEMRRPGTLERTFSNVGGGAGGGGFGGPGLGSMFLYSLAGSFVGTAIAQSFFANDTGFDQGADQAGDAGSGEHGDSAGADYASADYAGADTASGDYGGGDFGGGDFGGGDFGGGDFG